jgi:Monooxygenase af470-like
MKSIVNRRTVDLSAFPDLVVIYLGMRVNALTGIKTLIGFGPKIAKAVEENPDGLLLHESLLFSLLPPHVGMRQYWRNFESLERWSRSAPHREWWQSFVRDSGGTGFWHETYFARGGMEAIYDDVPQPIGFMRFAPIQPARGSLFSARKRLGLKGEPQGPDPIVEGEFYGNQPPGRNSG